MKSQKLTTKWFTEASLPYSDPEVKISIAYTDKIYDEKSPFGHIEVFDTLFFGRLLTIDGIIQVSEKDEFIYHEMMIGLPSLYHGDPRTILIIGGGDGGAVKTALQIPSIKKIVIVELDRKVIDICNQFLPTIGANSLADPKVELIIEDGKKFINSTELKFDLIALDLTDPIPESPAEDLFSRNFYESLKKSLNPKGIIITHCGSLLFQTSEVKEIAKRIANTYSNIAFHAATIPTYQLSLFGFILASNDLSFDLEVASGNFDTMFSSKPKYLSKGMILATRHLPPYLLSQIGLNKYLK